MSIYRILNAEVNKKVVVAALAAMIGFHSLMGAQAPAENILVSSTRSNSIEQFTTSGTWIRTFATTGPYAPTAVAQSPLTGEVFVATEVNGVPTNVILRYKATGEFDPNWDTFTVNCGTVCPTAPTWATYSLLFDSVGNLFIAT